VGNTELFRRRRVLHLFLHLQTSAPSWDWNPLRGYGLCGNEEFESASTEARSEGSGWLEIMMEGKLGKNNAGRRPMPRPVRQRWRRGAAAAPLPTRLRGGAGAAALASAALVADRAAQRIDDTDLFAGKTMVPSESLRPA
jgi:hypothetical protein